MNWESGASALLTLYRDWATHSLNNHFAYAEAKASAFLVLRLVFLKFPKVYKEVVNFLCRNPASKVLNSKNKADFGGEIFKSFYLLCGQGKFDLRTDWAKLERVWQEVDKDLGEAAKIPIQMMIMKSVIGPTFWGNQSYLL